MEIQGKEYLQIGYDADLFNSVYSNESEKLRKTAVDPSPNWERRKNPEHHIFHETFIEFSRYIPNQYDTIHFTRDCTAFELKQAERLLSPNGIILHG